MVAATMVSFLTSTSHNFCKKSAGFFDKKTQVFIKKNKRLTQQTWCCLKETRGNL